MQQRVEIRNAAHSGKMPMKVSGQITTNETRAPNHSLALERTPCPTPARFVEWSEPTFAIPGTHDVSWVRLLDAVRPRVRIAIAPRLAIARRAVHQVIKRPTLTEIPSEQFNDAVLVRYIARILIDRTLTVGRVVYCFIAIENIARHDVRPIARKQQGACLTDAPACSGHQHVFPAYIQHMSSPRFTETVCPVMLAAASDARNR